jgi:hypothetical protein
MAMKYKDKTEPGSWPDNYCPDAIARYQAGMSIDEIAQSYSVGKMTMWRVLTSRACIFRHGHRLGNKGLAGRVRKKLVNDHPDVKCVIVRKKYNERCHGYDDCSNYSNCLDYVAKKGWDGFVGLPKENVCIC